MSNTFFIADTHFGHKNIIIQDDHKIRPYDSVEAMNEALVANWNARVKPSDTIYHLGDVAMWKADQLDICKRLNGTKYLIRGNHDQFPSSVYRRVGFEDIVNYKEFKLDATTGKFICTHIPIHSSELNSHWGKHGLIVNVHGHLHRKVVQTASPEEGIFPDPRYLCISVEQTNYSPVSLEEVRQLLRDRNL